MGDDVGDSPKLATNERRARQTLPCDLRGVMRHIEDPAVSATTQSAAGADSGSTTTHRGDDLVVVTQLPAAGARSGPAGVTVTDASDPRDYAQHSPVTRVEPRWLKRYPFVVALADGLAAWSQRWSRSPLSRRRWPAGSWRSSPRRGSPPSPSGGPTSTVSSATAARSTSGSFTQRRSARRHRHPGVRPRLPATRGVVVIGLPWPCSVPRRALGCPADPARPAPPEDAACSASSSSDSSVRWPS